MEHFTKNILVNITSFKSQFSFKKMRVKELCVRFFVVCDVIIYFFSELFAEFCKSKYIFCFMLKIYYFSIYTCDKKVELKNSIFYVRKCIFFYYKLFFTFYIFLEIKSYTSACAQKCIYLFFLS